MNKGEELALFLKEKRDILYMVVFFESWNKIGKTMKKEIEKLNSTNSMQFYKTLFVSDDAQLQYFGVVSTPAVSFFYNGDSIEIERKGWDIDKKRKS